MHELKDLPEDVLLDEQALELLETLALCGGELPNELLRGMLELSPEDFPAPWQRCRDAGLLEEVPPPAPGRLPALRVAAPWLPALQTLDATDPQHERRLDDSLEALHAASRSALLALSLAPPEQTAGATALLQGCGPALLALVPLALAAGRLERAQDLAEALLPLLRDEDRTEDWIRVARHALEAATQSEQQARQRRSDPVEPLRRRIIALCNLAYGYQAQGRSAEAGEALSAAVIADAELPASAEHSVGTRDLLALAEIEGLQRGHAARAQELLSEAERRLGAEPEAERGALEALRLGLRGLLLGRTGDLAAGLRELLAGLDLALEHEYPLVVALLDRSVALLQDAVAAGQSEPLAREIPPLLVARMAPERLDRLPEGRARAHAELAHMLWAWMGMVGLAGLHAPAWERAHEQAAVIDALSAERWGLAPWLREAVPPPLADPSEA